VPGTILAMYSATTYTIRPATEADAPALRDLAALDGARPLAGLVLVGEIDGRPAAAIAPGDGRVVADPFVRTAQLASMLRLRAQALVAYKHQPSLRRRIRAALRPVAVAA